MKKCARCKSMVDPATFPVNRKAADGLGSYCKPCVREFKAEYALTPRGKAKRLEWSNRYRRANRSKSLAHRIVGKALARGDIQRQPCEACGSEQAHAHHDDYNKPLEVRWLCTFHHREWHMSNTPIKADREPPAKSRIPSTGIPGVYQASNGKFHARHRGQHLGTFATTAAALAAIAECKGEAA